MGSFVGHIDEAIFFLLLGVWWMYNKFIAHIRSRWNKTEYTARLSYPLPCKVFIPLEAILKTAFPVAGLIGEICSEGLSLTDEDGNFRKIAQMQHMTIYCMFICHGIIDLLMTYGVPLPKGLDYVSAFFAFIWYGLTFSFHAHMHGKAMMETNIHILPIYIICGLVIAGTFEFFMPHQFIIELIRVYCILVLGTWFVHVAFILYLPYPWPGSEANPKWDQMDERNIQFVVVAFGFHLILNLCIVTVGYLLTYCGLRMKGEGRFQFKPLLNKGDEEI